MSKIIYEAKIIFKITENIENEIGCSMQKDMDNAILEMMEDNLDRDKADYEITLTSTMENN